MAKVKTIKFDIDGKEYSYNVNVNKDGIFKCAIDYNISVKLGLEKSLFESSVLDNVVRPIETAHREYVTSSKSYSLHILIKYQASGIYSLEEFGTKKRFESRFHSITDTPAIHFDYEVLIKECIGSDGQVIFYRSKMINEYVRENIDKGNPQNIKYIDDYYVGSQFYSNPEGVVIPYSQEAINTLDKAKDGIKGISTVLYNVLSKDVLEVEQAMINNKLLK